MAAALGTAALCACTEELNEISNPGHVLQVSTTVNAATRAIVEGQLGAGEKIGISLLASDGSDYNGKKTGYKNIPYNSELLTTGGVKWASENPIILSPATGTTYAYYPYSAAVSDIKAIPVETASQTDYMYADPVEGLSSSNSKANFSLNHALCAFQINIKNDSYTQGPGNISRMAVSSAELATAASLNSMTGELSAFTGQGSEIEDTQAFTIGKETHSTTIMAVPAGGQENLTVKITLDGKTYNITMPMKEAFTSGKRYLMEILVKDKTAPLEVVSVQVKPWIDEDLGAQDMEVSGTHKKNEYTIKVEVIDNAIFYSNVKAFTGSIDWGDGTVTEHTNESNPTHIYTQAGVYTITHIGKCAALSYSDIVNLIENGTFTPSITDILSIGRDMGITDMTAAFYTCTQLCNLREGIFDDLTEVTEFSYTFHGCSSLTAIPSGLFDNYSNVTIFLGTFAECSSLTTIPAGLFDKCTKVTGFYHTFQGCSALTAIPAGLFDKCTLVTDFDETFYGCSALTAIPAGLFDKCTLVTDFNNAFFRCSALTAIPQGLFDNCTQVKYFYGTFSGCTALTAIPQGLFDNCPLVRRFEETFSDCSSLTGESPYTQINGQKVHLYERHLYPDQFSTPTSYKAAFDRCTSLTDYNEIPASWGGGKK